MTPIRVLLAAAAAAVVATLAGAAPASAAQGEPSREPERGETREFRRMPMPQGTYMDMVVRRRARLGINVNLQARETDTLGAWVEAVTPGGPADKAGIRSGDVITRLGGTALVEGRRRDDAARGDGEAGRSLPGLRLIELAAKLDVNDTVTVELRRGAGFRERRTVRVVTSDVSDEIVLHGPDGARGFAYRFGPGGDMFERLPMGEGMEMSMPRVRMFFGGPLGELELAPLNAELGQYFGTSEGVLVISAPKDAKLNLKGGDVVLAVDGRKPTSPGHLLRILRSYEGGESIKLDVMRNRRRETVTATLDAERQMRRTPAPARTPAPSRPKTRS